MQLPKMVRLKSLFYNNFIILIYIYISYFVEMKSKNLFLKIVSGFI